MSLYNNILLEIQQGNIPKTFKIDNLKMNPVCDGEFKIGNERYKLTTINTMPANLAIDAKGGAPGNHVQKGAKPRFVRIERGIYRLHCPDSIQNAEVNEEELCNVNDRDIEQKTYNDPDLVDPPNDPVSLIAQYLKEVPFQYFFKKQRIAHPVAPVVGLRNRVNCYFWPSLQDTWEMNKTKLANYEARFKALEPSIVLAENAGELEKLFSEICQWGGVKMPEIDKEQLRLSVIEVLACIDAGQLPPNFCRINSAYTKLYALARPASFVIFDSRVAAALLSILDPYMELISQQLGWDKYAGLGYVSGRGGSRPRLMDWPWRSGYQKWEAQLAANALCIDVLEYINSNLQSFDLNHSLNLRELEAILFMEGY